MLFALGAALLLGVAVLTLAWGYRSGLAGLLLDKGLRR